MTKLLDDFNGLMGRGGNVVSFEAHARIASIIKAKEKFLRICFSIEEKPREEKKERDESRYIRETTKRKIESMKKHNDWMRRHNSDCLGMYPEGSEEHALFQEYGRVLWKAQKEASTTLEAYLTIQKSKKSFKEVK